MHSPTPSRSSWSSANLHSAVSPPREDLLSRWRRRSLGPGDCSLASCLSHGQSGFKFCSFRCQSPVVLYERRGWVMSSLGLNDAVWLHASPTVSRGSNSAIQSQEVWSAQFGIMPLPRSVGVQILCPIRCPNCLLWVLGQSGPKCCSHSRKLQLRLTFLWGREQG